MRQNSLPFTANADGCLMCQLVEATEDDLAPLPMMDADPVEVADFLAHLAHTVDLAGVHEGERVS